MHDHGLYPFPVGRPSVLGSLDRRGKAARLLEAEISSLVEHVGGNPTIVQRKLIERAARLALYLNQADRKADEAGGLSDHARREYLAWHNSYVRTLSAIGVKGEPGGKTPDLQSYLRDAGK